MLFHWQGSAASMWLRPPMLPFLVALYDATLTLRARKL